MFRAMGSFVSVNKHVMRRRLLFVLVKDRPGSLVGQRGVGDTAQCTWQGRHQTPGPPRVVPAVLEDGARHVGVVEPVVRLKLSVETLLESVARLCVGATAVAAGHTDPAGQLGGALSTGGLGGQAWPDTNKIKINKNNKNNKKCSDSG